MRLMDVSHEAQTLGAALNHAAFNLANALGAWLGGLVLAAGLGLAAPMWVAVGLTVAGAVIFTVALALERRGREGSRTGRRLDECLANAPAPACVDKEGDR
jgi:DHA1 family inner membrane transport protein